MQALDAELPKSVVVRALIATVHALVLIGGVTITVAWMRVDGPVWLSVVMKIVSACVILAIGIICPVSNGEYEIVKRDLMATLRVNDRPLTDGEFNDLSGGSIWRPDVQDGHEIMVGEDMVHLHSNVDGSIIIMSRRRSE